MLLADSARNSVIFRSLFIPPGMLLGEGPACGFQARQVAGMAESVNASVRLGSDLYEQPLRVRQMFRCLNSQFLL
jgi:hypothetical protein